MKSKYDIKWHEELDSTNNEALRTAAGLENMSVIAAEYQSSGRGQRGNAWKSDKGENLTFSILLRFQNEGPETNSGGLLPPVRAAGQFRISEAAAAAQCTLLERHGIPSEIKWPNDIYAGDRKISGMLVENSLSGSFLSTSVVGIGLNVNQLSFPPDLPNPTSMAVITGKRYDIRTLLEEFMEIFCGHIVMPDDRLRQIYLSRLYRMGREALFADLAQHTVQFVEGIEIDHVVAFAVFSGRDIVGRADDVQTMPVHAFGGLGQLFGGYAFPVIGVRGFHQIVEVSGAVGRIARADKSFGRFRPFFAFDIGTAALIIGKTAAAGTKFGHEKPFLAKGEAAS